MGLNMTTHNERNVVWMVFAWRNYNHNYNLSIYLNSAKLECVQKVKHLGMCLTPDMFNSKELIEKKENFIGQTNHILAKYANIYSHVKCKSHLYELETWDLSNLLFEYCFR